MKLMNQQYQPPWNAQLVIGEYTLPDPRPFGFLVRARNGSCAMEEALAHIPDSEFQRVCVLILDGGGTVLERYSDDDYLFFDDSEAAALN